MQLPPDLSVRHTDKNRIVQSALRRGSVRNVIADQEALTLLQPVFNHELPELTKATDQMQTGCCWIFAGLNVLRHHLVRAFKLDPAFELSQAYFLLCDKLERCNVALELLYHLARRPDDGTYGGANSIEHALLVPSTINDGGTAQQFCCIVKKYGVVPKGAFPTTYLAKNTDILNELLLACVLKVKALPELATMPRDAFDSHKRHVLDECHRILTLCLGSMPSAIEFRGKVYADGRAFYAAVVKPIVDLDDYVAISNDPRHPYGTVTAVRFAHNLLTEADTDLATKATNAYLNVDGAAFKRAVFRTLTEHKTPVWFGAVYGGPFLLNNGLVLDQKYTHLDDVFDVKFVLPKATMLACRTQVPNHAMVLLGCQTTGTRLRSGGTRTAYVRWKVENSHGPIGGKDDGILTMSDAFMEQFVIEALVHKKTLPRAQVKALAALKDVRWMPFWDAVGGVGPS